MTAQQQFECRRDLTVLREQMADWITDRDLRNVMLGLVDHAFQKVTERDSNAFRTTMECIKIAHNSMSLFSLTRGLSA